MKSRRPPATPRQRKAALAFAVAVAVLGLLGWWAVKFGSTTVESPATGSTSVAGATTWPDEAALARLAEDLPTISIRPFEAAPGDARAATIARGLDWDLAERLGQVTGLRVVGSDGRDASPDRQASAGYVVGGSVQSGTSTIRVHAALADRQSGRQLWTARLEKAPGEVLDLPGEIAVKLAGALPVPVNELERRRLSSPHTRSPQAFETFMRGEAAFLARSADGNARARELFREAISIDPRFARAYAAIAMTHVEDSRPWRDKGREESLAEAGRMAEAALLIDPASRDAHWVRSYIALSERRLGDAKAAIGQALAVDPSFADAYALLAWIHILEDEPSRAVPMLRVAIRLDSADASRRAWLEGMPMADEGQRRRLGDALRELGH
ncbi:MAG: hypothetical protein KIS74_02190 [Burkholderiales bacterium]|nr:hypothetical protein [Burkholderiales bacterium]